MKKLYILCALLLQGLVMLPASADELKDFGFRTTIGATRGITSEALPEVSFWADFYLLSQQTRMLFGFSMLSGERSDLPWISIQSIGIEQNIPLESGQLFVGVLYNKAYLSEENSGFEPQRGLSYHVGYKLPIDHYQDLVFWVGHQYQPLEKTAKAPAVELSSHTSYARVGWEWYF